MEETLPPRLQEIVEDFQLIQGTEKLEYLLEFAENMPPLPDWLAAKRDTMDQVHECMTPVYIHAQNENGRLHYYFDVPPDAPTVRGYAAILSEGLRGLTPEELLAVPHDFYTQLGLQSVISAQRLNGISAMLAHMKQLALPHLQNGQTKT